MQQRALCMFIIYTFLLCGFTAQVATAEINNIEVKPRYRQNHRAPQQKSLPKPSKKPQQQPAPCGGYIFDESERPKNMFDKAIDVVGGLASLGRKISLLAGIMIIGSGLMQYNNYLNNPLQTRLLYAITTIFAGIALVGLGFLSVDHVAAVLW